MRAAGLKATQRLAQAALILLLLSSGTALAQDEPSWFARNSWAAGPVAVLLLLAGAGTALALARAGRRRDLLMQSFDTSGQARQLVGPYGRIIFANAAYRRIFANHSVPLPEALEALVEPGSTSAE